MRIFHVDLLEPDPAIIAEAATILKDGGLVAFPTETVYGLGANALDSAAVAKIFVAKGRPSSNPIIVHVARTEDAISLVESWPKRAQLVADRFWPGPLTIILPRSNLIPDIVTGGGSTVAIRCPVHPVARALIAAAGLPIAAPSANRSSELSPTCAEHVALGLGDRIDALLDGGPTSAGIESTVLDLSGDQPRLLRPGPIPPDELEAVLGPIERTMTHEHSSGSPLPSPGLLERHYAPNTTLECISSLAGIAERARDLLASGLRVASIVTRPMGISSREVLLPENPEEFATDLYRVLHELDAGGFDRILCWLPPETDAWLGVRDRLLRASAKRT